MPRLLAITPVLLAIAMVLLAIAGCGGEAPWVDGTVPGGALSPTELAAHHYETSLLPTSSAASSVLVPEVVETDEGTLRKIVSYTKTYHVDRYYEAMVGPHSNMRVSLHQGRRNAAPELLWVKGISAEIVDETGTPLSQEYTCHVVASIASMREHNQALGLVARDPRFTALAQGLYHKEYPTGFGLPVYSTDELGINSQILNYNTPASDAPLRLRHRVVILYIRDQDRVAPMAPITNTFAQALVRLDENEEGYFGVRLPDTETHGESCAMGTKAVADSDDMLDAYGHRFSAHWVVEPGRSLNHTLVTKMMAIKYDTRIHVIDVHLHPFGEWVELRDLTAGETLFRGEADQLAHGRGLARVQSYASAEGIPVYADHEYALVSEYDNTSDEPRDAMAILYLGLRDKQFDRSLIHDPEARARRKAEREAAELVRLKQAVAADPQDPVARYDLGLGFFHTGQLDRAAQEFAAASELDPTHAPAQRALERTLRAMNPARSSASPEAQ